MRCQKLMAEPLSPAERIRLVEDLWDSIEGVPGAVALSEAECRELAVRIEAYQRDPTAGSPWQAVKARLRGTH